MLKKNETKSKDKDNKINNLNTIHQEYLTK
jgi:hypothetical protein